MKKMKCFFERKGLNNLIQFFEYNQSGYYHSTIFKVSVSVIIPTTPPFSLTRTHFENLTKGTSALAGVEKSTSGGGGSIIIEIVKLRHPSFSAFSTMFFSKQSSLTIPTTREPSNTGI